MNRDIGDSQTMRLRRSVLAQASGAVLEIGIGTGLNLGLFPETLCSLTAVDPYPDLVSAPALPYPFRLERMPAEEMRFADDRFDTIVSTYTLCSVRDISKVLSEVRRVLKPGGKFLFLEHGKAWRNCSVWLQELTNPLYRTFACGCNVNRDIIAAIRAADLRIGEQKRYAFPWHPISGYVFFGAAEK